MTSSYTTEPIHTIAQVISTSYTLQLQFRMHPITSMPQYCQYMYVVIYQVLQRKAIAFASQVYCDPAYEENGDCDEGTRSVFVHLIFQKRWQVGMYVCCEVAEQPHSEAFSLDRFHAVQVKIPCCMCYLAYSLKDLPCILELIDFLSYVGSLWTLSIPPTKNTID